MRPLIIMMLAAAAAFAQPAADPGGWSKAKWGMTETQLAEAFGGDAIHLETPDQNGVRTVVLLDVAGIPCFAEMLPDQAGYLSSVMIVPRKVSDMTGSLYLIFQKMLIQKYGPPKSVETSDTTGMIWTFPTTVIVLGRGKIPSASSRGFAIKYKRVTPDSNPL